MKNQLRAEKVINLLPSFNFALGIIVCLGGLIGYFKAGSNVSLSLGLFCGNLLMLSIWGSKEKVWGTWLALFISLALVLIFAKRFIQTGAPIPALIILPLATLGLAGNSFAAYLKISKAKKDS